MKIYCNRNGIGSRKYSVSMVIPLPRSLQFFSSCCFPSAKILISMSQFAARNYTKNVEISIEPLVPQAPTSSWLKLLIKNGMCCDWCSILYAHVLRSCGGRIEAKIATIFCYRRILLSNTYERKLSLSLKSQRLEALNYPISILYRHCYTTLYRFEPFFPHHNHRQRGKELLYTLLMIRARYTWASKSIDCIIIQTTLSTTWTLFTLRIIGSALLILSSLNQ